MKRPTSPSAIRTWTEIRSTMLRVTCRKRFDVHDRQQAVDGPRLLMISAITGASQPQKVAVPVPCVSLESESRFLVAEYGVRYMARDLWR